MTVACPTDLLPLAAAGTLPADETERVEAHLAGCADCRAAYGEWSGQGSAPERTGDPAEAGGGRAGPAATGTLDFGPFAHLAWPKAQRYRRILRAFADARDGFVVHLRPEDIAAALGEPPSEQLGKDLDVLADAGNLRDSPDTSRVTTVEDFRRRRRLYALSREGEAAEAALRTYGATLARSAELQAVALEDIRVGLRTLVALAEQDEPDEARVSATLRDLETVFTGLADNAAAFMASLSRSIDTAALGVEAFVAYKDRLIGYLQRFIGDLVVTSAEIAHHLEVLDRLGIDRLLAVAAARQAADAAPDDEAGTEAARRHVDAWRARWAGLRRWFLGERGAPSQAELLRARARAAIPELLEAVALLHERRAGRTDRAADFTTLARWFAEAPTDADAHRLWRVAFGLAPARHLTVDGDTLDARREHPVPASTSWRDAPRVRVSARLRRTGSYERRGPVRSTDRSDARAQLARRLAAERAETALARRRLATAGPTRLSDLDLDPDTFPLFLRILGDALASLGRDGGAETTTTDGVFAVRLRPAPDGRMADIATPSGVLRGPDHVIEITDVLAAS
jgi:uncharacterized protein (TIGR02677 family)